MSLVAKRLHLADEVGLEKRHAGLPVRDAGVEEQVAARLRSECGSFGIDAEIGNRLARLLIDESVRRQELLSLPEPLGLHAVVVGGAGRMGLWLARYLRSRGYDVMIVDPAGPVDGFPWEPSLRKALASADVTAVAVPISAAGPVLEQIHHARPEHLVFDLCSLKDPVAVRLRAMARSGLSLASVHPLFGPGLWPLSRGTILVCDCGDEDAVTEAKELFRGTGAALVDVPLDDHDEFMAYLLGLSHLTLLAFARAASRGSIEAFLAGAEGTTFARLAGVARGLLDDSPALLRDIQALNPHTPQVVRRLRDALTEWEEAAKDSDPKGFVTLLEQTRSFMGGGSR